jgi:hypothetical protein
MPKQTQPLCLCACCNWSCFVYEARLDRALHVVFQNVNKNVPCLGYQAELKKFFYFTSLKRKVIRISAVVQRRGAGSPKAFLINVKYKVFTQ